MKTIIDKYFHLICIGMGIIIISIIMINGYFNNKKILKAPKYTIALIISDWHHKNTNGIGVDYEYFVNKKRFLSTINLDLKKNDKYLLIFDSLQPKNNTLLETYKVDKIFNAPDNGWLLSELPIKVDTVKIKNTVLGN
ncbi:hypothetical protein SAMN05421856_1253 [Chryseobacterium taichungense]|uniref:Uncharacterized protein n=1 Tax=Chryseobacterium taichungense TaxID=295069 RepID=A0A1H8DZS7_9FLAO|nr:hypothetical protein [Chryseobacterium taichungense]SEN12703.1 hypothetical protein SAMN05421856_1253 [Chryseobacterium taichungense]